AGEVGEAADATRGLPCSDGTSHVTVLASAGTADLSSLADGPISSVLNVTDDAGNTAHANGAVIDLDTTADAGNDLTLSITDTTINRKSIAEGKITDLGGD